MTQRLGLLWQAYERELSRAPIRTQCITSTSLWALGDAISQRIEGKQKWNPKQTAYAAAFGSILGVVGHKWYQALDKGVAHIANRGSKRFIAAKVVFDEGIFGPLHVLGFFTFMTKAEGGTWQDVKHKIERDFVSTYLAELAFWPAFQAFNFAKVPVRHQLLAVNSACLLDATFLCWVNTQQDWLAAIGLKKDGSDTID